MTTNIVAALGLLSSFAVGGMAMVGLQQISEIPLEQETSSISASYPPEEEEVWESGLECSVIMPEGEVPNGIAYEYVLDENGDYVVVEGSGVEVTEFDAQYEYDGSIKEGDKLPVFPVGTAKGAVTWGGATTRGIS